MNWVLAHFIGDYLIQNDWMALNKKKSSWHCMIHAVTYMIPFCFCGLEWWQFELIGFQHFLQDRFDFVVWFMKRKGSGGFASGPCSPWSIIVTDNVLHICWIAFVVWLGTFWR